MPWITLARDIVVSREEIGCHGTGHGGNNPHAAEIADTLPKAAFRPFFDKALPRPSKTQNFDAEDRNF
jgi:hypothetical protein